MSAVGSSSVVVLGVLVQHGAQAALAEEERQLQPPRPDHPIADLSHKPIKRRPILGGLINKYEGAA